MHRPASAAPSGRPPDRHTTTAPGRRIRNVVSDQSPHGAARRCRHARRRRPGCRTRTRRRAAEGGLRLCRAGGRFRFLIPARPRAQGAAGEARGQDPDQLRGKSCRGSGLRAGVPPARQYRPRHDLWLLVRLHEPDGPRRPAVPEGLFRARHRLQDRSQPRRVQRAVLRGADRLRHHRRARLQKRRRRLYRLGADPRSGHGHQCLHPGGAQDQPEFQGQGDLGQFLVRSGQGGRRRESR